MCDIKNQQIGIAVLTQLSIDIAFDSQCRWIFKSIDGGNTWPDWCKPVQTFAEIPLFVPGLQIACTHIIQNCIAKYIIISVFFRHIFCILANDYCQLCFIIQAVYQIFICRNTAAISHRFVYPFGKINGIRAFTAKGFFFVAGRFFGMCHIIDTQTDNILFRMWNCRTWNGVGAIDFQQLFPQLFFMQCGFQHFQLSRCNPRNQLIHISKVHIKLRKRIQNAFVFKISNGQFLFSLFR